MLSLTGEIGCRIAAWTRRPYKADSYRLDDESQEWNYAGKVAFLQTYTLQVIDTLINPFF